MRDTFTHRGLRFSVVIEHDDSMGEPWKEHDGHGVISDWTTRDKSPGERVLVKDGRHARYYDVEATMPIAIRDGWDAEPYHTAFPGETKRQQAARAVEADFERMRAWCRDEWQWIGVIVTREDTGEQARLWGIESDSDKYHATVARELAEELIYDDDDRAKLDAARVIAPWPDVR